MSRSGLSDIAENAACFAYSPELEAIIAEIEADMAEQLERVREMERNGELEPIPEISATTH